LPDMGVKHGDGRTDPLGNTPNGILMSQTILMGLKTTLCLKDSMVLGMMWEVKEY